jgi:hypothetical protein
MSLKVQNKRGIEYLGIKSAIGDYVYGCEKPLYQMYNELYDREYEESVWSMNYHNCLSQDEINELMIMEKETMGEEFYSPKDDDTVTVDDKIALDLLNKRVKKLPNENNYIAPLLWKQEKFELPTKESFKLAYRRCLIVEKQAIKLKKFDECISQIKNLIDKNYAVELTQEEMNQMHKKAYYNPIFFLHSPTKRTRLIWDLAAKVNGQCLNDFLLSGPNLYNKLLDILFKMREKQFMVKGDIGEMFHQIKVDEDDTNALRFLFRFSQDEKIRVFKVLPFGAKCSPVISQYVKNKVAEEYKNISPKTSSIILRNAYVDDIVMSTKSEIEATQQIVLVKKILLTGGFNFLKINSNSENVKNNIKKYLSPDELTYEKLFCSE